MCKFKPALLSHIKNKFRWQKLELETVEDVTNIYVKMIANVCGKLGLIGSVKTQTKGKRSRVKTYNIIELQSIINLIILKSHENLGSYDQNILVTMGKYVNIPKSVNREPRKDYEIPVRFFEDT